MPVVNLLVIFSVVFFLLGCKDDEPQVDFCVIESQEQLHCFPADSKKEEYKRAIKDCIGCMAVTASEFGEMKKHHSEIHTELEHCEF